ncbi:hypothetical protein SAMN05428949_0287 [Chitinophaga sp. YR627]|nr:hypothetical protein SAMN05428949_0287 [Chitinophaga sp. YR627]
MAREISVIIDITLDYQQFEECLYTRLSSKALSFCFFSLTPSLLWWFLHRCWKFWELVLNLIQGGQ